MGVLTGRLRMPPAITGRLAVKEGRLRVLNPRKGLRRFRGLFQMTKTTAMKVGCPKLSKSFSLSTNKIFNTPPNLQGQIREIRNQETSRLT